METAKTLSPSEFVALGEAIMEVLKEKLFLNSL